MASFTPRPLYPGERAHVARWIGGWVGPKAGLDDVERRKTFPLPGLRNSDPSAVHPEASRYTDCATPAAETLETS
jgi:hypothetical protein